MQVLLAENIYHVKDVLNVVVFS